MGVNRNHPTSKSDLLDNRNLYHACAICNLLVFRSDSRACLASRDCQELKFPRGQGMHMIMCYGATCFEYVVHHPEPIISRSSALKKSPKLHTHLDIGPNLKTRRGVSPRKHLPSRKDIVKPKSSWSYGNFTALKYSLHASYFVHTVSLLQVNQMITILPAAWRYLPLRAINNSFLICHTSKAVWISRPNSVHSLAFLLEENSSSGRLSTSTISSQ